MTVARRGDGRVESRQAYSRARALGGAVYERRDDVIDVLHTYTPPALRGGNLAAELTRAALDFARAEGLRVVPTCSYTRRYLARHGA